MTSKSQGIQSKALDTSCIKELSTLQLCEDDITISAGANSTDDILKILKEESESAVKWFRENNMLQILANSTRQFSLAKRK